MATKKEKGRVAAARRLAQFTGIWAPPTPEVADFIAAVIEHNRANLHQRVGGTRLAEWLLEEFSLTVSRNILDRMLRAGRLAS